MTRTLERWWVGIGASCCAHALIWTQLGSIATEPTQQRRARDLELSWVQLAPPPQPLEPEARPQAPPEPKPKLNPPRPTLKPAKVELEPAPPVETSPAPEPAALASAIDVPNLAPASTSGGVPIVMPAAAPAPALRAGAAGTGLARVATPQAAPVVALRDLSRRPRAPSLDAKLRQHYPTDLRRRGVEGTAEVGIIVDARGRVARVDALSETAPGFARACKETLSGGQWTPPLARDGTPVATRLTYRCRFEIED